MTVIWITLKMQQILNAHGIPSRFLEQGGAVCLGLANLIAFQVQPQDQWTALLLLSSLEEDREHQKPQTE
ncbi:MAG: hypothetical protein EBV05_12990 [Cyanobacteria bacterium WB6_1B_304]|jgi:ribosomal protein L5|nr:hypothetical protein [Cyanobacteria bacterium WB6_1B_304]